MPLLGIFSKRDKHQSSPEEAAGVASVHSPSESDTADSEYILPTSNVPASRNGHNIYNGPAGASSSKLKLPGFRRKGHGSPAVVSAKNVGNAARDPKTCALSSAASEADLDLLKVPLPDKKSLFASPAYGDPHSARSTRSLPNERGHSRQPSQDSVKTDVMKKPKQLPSPFVPKADKKSGGLFSWATRERTKSKPSRPPSPPVESFNLKSFRHVGPAESPSVSPRPVSPAPSIPFSPTPPPRPRGNSVASESSQRISVAAFREAQARRSAAPSPVPSLRPPSTLDLPRPPITPNQSPRASGVQPAGPRAQSRPPPRRSTAPAIPTNSSSEEEESEEEEESDSDAEATLRPGRQRTITQRARSELGHRSPGASSNKVKKQSSGSKSELGHGQNLVVSPPLRTARSRSSNFEEGSPASFNRVRRSSDMSSMTPVPATNQGPETTRGSAAVHDSSETTSRSAISAHQRQPARNAGTSDSESSHEDDEDEDNAPLSSLIQPKRPGTAMSGNSATTSASRARKPSQPPLIDVSSLGPSPPLPHKKDEEQSFTMSPLAFSPTNLTERLANLTKGLGSKSTDNLPAPQRDPATASAAAMPQPQPKRAATMSPVSDDALADMFSFSPILAKADSGPLGTSEPKLVSSSPESMSPVSSPVEQPEAKRIVPTPVRQREQPPSFSVTSRPRSTHTLSESHLSPPESKPPQPVPRMNSSHSSSGSSQPSTVRPPTLISLIPPGSGFGNTPVPKKPFAEPRRGNSPASSTGDSSSGRAPYTPRDGSDYGNDRAWDSKSVSNVSSNVEAARRRGHRKSSSVTFEDEVLQAKDQERERGRPTTVTKERAEMTDKEAEQKRRERRRSEAKAAIELGNLINGRGPIDNDDEDDEDAPISQNMPPRMNMLNPSNPMMGGMPSMNFGPSPSQQMPWIPPTQMLTPQVTGMLTPQAFMVPPPPMGADPNYLAAHERAMMIAKQTYQMAVAQQAMAAAAEEWERSSTYAGSTYGGGSMYNGGMGMGGLTPHWTGGSVMFPSGARSVYGASSVIGDDASEIGGGGWGSRSVYGESFGPPRNPMMYNGPGQGFYPPRTESMGQLAAQQQANGRAGARPRTKSSPHEQVNSPPRSSGQPGKKAPPPSSWTQRYQTALRDGS